MTEGIVYSTEEGKGGLSKQIIQERGKDVNEMRRGFVIASWVLGHEVS